MQRKLTPAQKRLEKLKSDCDGKTPDELFPIMKKALKDAHQLVVEKAAAICAGRFIRDLETDLIAAYQRFLKNPVKKDPQCRAKISLARALVELECKDFDFFIKGLQYRQLEPVWGGRTDTAADLRLTCAVGLSNTTYPRALIELIPMLYDPESQVRTGVVGIVGRMQPAAAEAVLRSKILAGDSESNVIAEALTELIKIAPEESVEFVSGFFDDNADQSLEEPLALSLGASRLDHALDILMSCWEQEPLKSRAQIFLRAAVLHRSEKAFSRLLEIAADDDDETARFVVEELSIYKTDVKLSAQMRAALDKKGDEDLMDLFRNLWR